MFGIFRNKSTEEKLQIKYNGLMKEWHTLSSINRSESDKKYAEAQEVLEELVALQKN
ncbi:Lacal_2735 family protein [Arenibacter sp. ARW7G5Y1]|uniref:Lacal_2735 family protein n=1 Tax=Arenibacter sp. ARW7G5Y1 TaxID=2135619 RepID=UPI000D756CF2|nr:Lacal_2735 family protein [Arenibacter sp. ARW7G5Y1]PXX27247.1 hypothetical protein C7972_10731 [Arenibacter sp. ARW7G5Y1]